MKVFLVVNYQREDAQDAARTITAYLNNLGIDVSWSQKDNSVSCVDPQTFDLCISLGGDGTLLRAAQMMRYSQVPILGLSFGHLGFLCNASDSYLETIERVLAGEMHCSPRSTLAVEIFSEDDYGNQKTVEHFALNEVALNRGFHGDIVQFSVSVSGKEIDELRADGFVVATATGSTGYALSAGGPFVTPEFNGMVCVPIAPHTILARAFLTSSSDCIEIVLSERRPVDRTIFIDGRLVAQGQSVKSIKVRRGSGDILLFDNGTADFYDSVSRVFWGKDPVHRD